MTRDCRRSLVVVVTMAAVLAPVVGTMLGSGSVGAHSAGITVQRVDAPRFVDVPYSEHRGDVVRIPVALPNGSVATLSIDSNATDYAATMTLHDGSDDGRVTLVWNTYLAGSEPPNATVRASADGDAATVRDASPVVDRPSPGTYDLRVAPGPNATTADRADLELESAQPPELTVLRARNGHFANLTAPADVAALRGAGELVRAPPTDFGDESLPAVLLDELVVLQVRAPGFAGALATADGPNATARFGDLLGRELGLHLREHPDTVSTMEDPGEFRFGDFAGRRVVADPGNDTYYVVLDPTAPVDVDGPGEFVHEHELEGYRVHLRTPPDARLPTGARENVTTSVRFVDVIAGVDAVDPQPRMGAARNVTVSGSAVLPPGDAVVVRVRGDDGEFSTERRVVVGADGAFAASVDLSALSAGERFEVVLRVDGTVFDRTTGRVSPWAVVRFDGGERYVQHVEVVRVDAVSTTDGGFVSVRRESAPGASLGHSAYLPPGNHTDVRVPLDAPLDGNVTLLAVVHRDDGDREFERADGPYRAGDPSAAATLVDVDGTPTATTTTTGSSTPTATAPDAGPIPASGPLGALVAVVVAALAAVAASRRTGDRDR